MTLFVDDLQRANVAALRRSLRSPGPKPQPCGPHPSREARRFRIAEPGRKPKVRWLCIECAAVLVDHHGVTLTGVNR